jgi:hypothetical protein
MTPRLTGPVTRLTPRYCRRRDRLSDKAGVERLTELLRDVKNQLNDISELTGRR